MQVKIFISYAHEDELLQQELALQLGALQRQGLISVWYDHEINAGIEWEPEIIEHLNAAHIILLLVSPNFMNSDYCFGVEMQRAIERHDRGEARVIPVILRPVYWQGVLGKLQVLPKDALPVTDPDWHNMDRAFFNVAEGILKVVKQLQSHSMVEVDQAINKHTGSLIVLTKKSMRSKIIDLYPGFHENINLKSRYSATVVEDKVDEHTVYGGTVCQDSFWAKIRQNTTIREMPSSIFLDTLALVFDNQALDANAHDCRT